MKKFIHFIMLFACFDALAQVDLEKGLVAHYPFSGNANDVSGKDLHGTVNGATLTTDRFGSSNSAYLFSGSANSYIIVKDDNSFKFENEFSFSLWYYKDATQVESNLNGIFFKGRDVENSTGFTLSQGKEYFYVRQDEIYIPGALSATAETSGNWHHAVGILSLNQKIEKKSDTSGILRLFIDGELVDKKTVPGYISDNSYPLVIGRHFRNADGSGAYEYPFTGKIDDIRFYNREITPDEIEALYKTATVGFNKNVKYSSISVFPNPVKNGKIILQNKGNEKILDLKLFDITGKCVKSQSNVMNETLDVSKFSAGLYSLQITTNAGILISKILIE